jgi:hypothetical protein
MLIERTFAIGGYLCVGSAGLFAAVAVASGALAVAPELLLTPVLFGIMGVMFLYAAAQARADRRALLSLGNASGPAGPDRPSP